jgi:chemotaxis protein MotA
MDIATIIGLITGIGLIVFAMLLEASYDLAELAKFWSASSIMIVLGGTMAATAIGFRLKEILRVFKLIKFVVSEPKFLLSNLVRELIEAAESHKKGTAELEKHIEGVKTHFIKDGLVFIINGMKYEDIKQILIKREEFRKNRESHEADLMKTLGTFSPAFGMVGTLIGLVFMLFNMGGDPAAMGPAMAVALITTFYGSVLANLVFIPFSEKLELRNKENADAHQLMIEGILLIWQKRHPLDVKDLLTAHISPEDRKQFQDDEQ